MASSIRSSTQRSRRVRTPFKVSNRPTGIWAAIRLRSAPTRRTAICWAWTSWELARKELGGCAGLWLWQGDQIHGGHVSGGVRRVSAFSPEQTVLVTAEQLRANGIRSFEIRQRQNEVVFTFPGAIHLGINQGYNYAVACNLVSSFLGKGRSRSCRIRRQSTLLLSTT